MSIASTTFGKQNSLLHSSHITGMRAKTSNASPSAQDQNESLENLAQQSSSLPMSGDVTVYGSQSSIKDSRYINGLMTGYQIDNEFQSRLQGIVSQHKSMLEGVESYAVKALVGMKAEEAAKRYGEEYVTEKETERVEEERKQTEQEAEEKLQKKVEGNAEGETEDAVVQNKSENKISAETAQITAATSRVQSSPAAALADSQPSNASTARQTTTALPQQQEELESNSTSAHIARIDLQV